MKAIALLVVLLGLFGSTFATDYQSCLIGVNYTYFNLCPFAQDGGFTIPIKQTGANITFSLGANEIPACNNSDGITSDVWATLSGADSLSDVANDIADALAGNDDNNTCANFAVVSPNYTLLNDTDVDGGLLITFPPFAPNATVNTTIQLIFKLMCDKDLTDTNSTNFTVVSNDGFSAINDIITIVGYSRYGCPAVSLNSLIDFLAANQTIFAIVFGVIGLILTFLGLKMVNFAVFVISATLGTLASGTFFFEFVDISKAQWILWTVFAISLILGLGLGYLALKYEKAAYFLVGGALGLVGGLMLYNAVLSHVFAVQLGDGDIGTAPLYVTIVVCALIGGVAAIFLLEDIIIIATSVIGSYAFVRAISSFIGGFPSEAAVADGITSFGAAAYGYLAGIIILAGLGMFVQFKTRSKSDKDDSGSELHMPRDNYYRY